MILTREEILSLLREGRLRIEPFHEECLGEVSYDITLADEFVFVSPSRTSIVDPENLESLTTERVRASEIILQPHDFVLARSREWIELPPDVMALVSGKSSIARLGLEVETAYILHAGHSGFVVLEIGNRNRVPIKLKAGMTIAQLIFFKLPHPVKPYVKTGTFGVQRTIELPRRISIIK